MKRLIEVLKDSCNFIFLQDFDKHGQNECLLIDYELNTEDTAAIAKAFRIGTLDERCAMEGASWQQYLPVVKWGDDFREIARW